MRRGLASSVVRSRFVDFFAERGHERVRSSPVVPYCDPTVPFTNAGMNQFKPVFLGRLPPPCASAVNSQKCVRVGGRHNDLDAVGHDGTHHTFFEMLGSWSFGDYYKREACEMAWTLLVDRYDIPEERLLVSYFGGDASSGLEPDLETRHAWLRLGVRADRLSARGSEHNFWEMGAAGPCGPCTEIHYIDDHNRATEIWNIVFIQHERLEDGSIEPLPKRYVDTGMGLERITALLQNKNSNYDTDLFKPLLETIHKGSHAVPIYKGEFGSEAHIDTAYRILADHSRMISICLADGVYPCSNLRLRSVLRKAISISKDIFQCSSSLLLPLYDRVADSLGCTYPELYKKMDYSKEIISNEEHSYFLAEAKMLKERKSLLQQYPEIAALPKEFLLGLSEGYKFLKKEMKTITDNKIPGHFVFKLYDTFGLNPTIIKKIADINNMSVDFESFERHLEDHKSKHKSAISSAFASNINKKVTDSVSYLVSNGMKFTNDVYKYEYSAGSNGEYEFCRLKTKLKAILTAEGNILKTLCIHPSSNYFLIFDETNFYCDEGGQIHDIGEIAFETVSFIVKSTFKVLNIVLHFGYFENNKNEIMCSDTVNIEDVGVLSVNSKHRLSVMQHHSATHLLNAAVRKVLYPSVVCQMGSKVTSNNLTLHLNIYGKKLTSEAADQIQSLMKSICSSDTSISTNVINGQTLLALEDVMTVPGETYPETGIRVVEMQSLEEGNLTSKELCCGTHVLSTKHINDFTIVSIRGAGGPTPMITAVAGENAVKVDSIFQEAINLQEYFYQKNSSNIEVNNKILLLKSRLDEICKVEGTAYGTVQKCLEVISSVKNELIKRNKKSVIDLVQKEVTSVLFNSHQHKEKFIVHFLACSYLLEPGTLMLKNVFQYNFDKPILIMGCANGIIKAACQVPQNCINKKFNAEMWMNSITHVFETCVLPLSKSKHISEYASMKGKKVSLINCESLVNDAIKAATSFANDYYANIGNIGDEESEILVQK